MKYDRRLGSIAAEAPTCIISKWLENLKYQSHTFWYWLKWMTHNGIAVSLSFLTTLYTDHPGITRTTQQSTMVGPLGDPGFSTLDSTVFTNTHYMSGHSIEATYLFMLRNLVNGTIIISKSYNLHLFYHKPTLCLIMDTMVFCNYTLWNSKNRTPKSQIWDHKSHPQIFMEFLDLLKIILQRIYITELLLHKIGNSKTVANFGLPLYSNQQITRPDSNYVENCLI